MVFKCDLWENPKNPESDRKFYQDTKNPETINPNPNERKNHERGVRVQQIISVSGDPGNFKEIRAKYRGFFRRFRQKVAFFILKFHSPSAIFLVPTFERKYANADQFNINGTNDQQKIIDEFWRSSGAFLAKKNPVKTPLTTANNMPDGFYFHMQRSPFLQADVS